MSKILACSVIAIMKSRVLKFGGGISKSMCTYLMLLMWFLTKSIDLNDIARHWANNDATTLVWPGRCAKLK